MIRFIAALPTASGIDELDDAFDTQFQDMLRENQRYRIYLLAYSAFLLFLLAYAGRRLTNSYKLIGQVNQHLKVANETLEQRVAERTAELQRQSAQLAELAGGDEFVILLNEVALQEGAKRVANAALRDVAGITEMEGHAVQVSASIGSGSIRASTGISHYPEQLLNQADAAMYRAKQRGKNCYCFSEPTAWDAGASASAPAAASS